MPPPNPPKPAPRGADLRGYEIVVGVCGGIAAYKVAQVVSTLVQSDAGVTVAMTDAAQRFVAPLTFESLTARQVFTSIWHAANTHDPQHLNLTEAADLFIIAPATANIIGKMAHGIADDLVSTMVMSAACPVLLAPAMNTRMWENRVVQQNLKTLEGLGVKTIGPESGWLACRTVGAGRMSEPEAIVAAAVELLHNNPPKRAAK